MMIREIVFRVGGMDCADCALRIESAMSKVKGVVSAQVYLSTSRLVVRTASDDLETGEVIKAVERLGYKATPENATQTLSLYIEGMDCADEVAIIRKKFKGLVGVLNFEVNLTSQKMGVTYDPSELSSQDIIKSIAETGMKARLAKPKTKAGSWWQDFRVKLIAASGILLLAGFVLEWLGVDHNNARFIFGASILVGGYYPARMAFAGLRARTLNIYTLLVIATIGAIILNFWDEAATLVFVYTWGLSWKPTSQKKPGGL